VTARPAPALALLLATGCLHASPQPEPEPEEIRWVAARAGHTGTVKLYDGLALVAFADATWESPEVRAARVERVASWRAATEPERAALRAEEEALAARYDELTLSFFTPDTAENDLDASTTAWRIALVPQAGPERLPVEVRVLRADALLRALYPTIGDFDVVYRIRFARAAEPLAPPFTLRIAGPRGRIDFRFAPGAEPAVTGDRRG
jgi:hypothetical protein